MNTPIFQSRLRRVPRLLAMAAVAFGVPAVATPAAQAGEYQFFSCSDFVGRKLQTEDFKYQSVGLGHGDNKCGEQGYHHLTLPGSNMSGGQYTGFGLRVPDGSGLRLKDLRTTRQLVLYGGSDYDWGATSAYKFEWGNDPSSTFGVNTTREEWCELTQPCGGFGWPEVNSGSDQFVSGFIGGATFVGFSLSCQNNPGMSGGFCSGSGGSGRGKLLLGRTQITVLDNDLPQISNAGGELLATGTHDGFEKVTFTAADTGSGVLDAFLKVDGKELTRVPTNGAPASCKDQGNVPAFDYTRLQPCARNGVVEMGVNTNAYSDGKHRITMQVRDAAGNLSGEMVHDIVIDNIAAPTLQGVEETNKPRIDGNAQVGQTLTAFDGRWTGSNVTFTRQWQVSDDGELWKGVGATGTTWRPEAGHVGKLVRVLVTATNAEGSTQAGSAGRRVEAGSGTGGGVVVQDDRPGSAPGGSEKSEPNGVGGKLATARLVASSKSEKIRTGYKKRTRVNGHLVDEAGVPITGASIDVYEKVITSGDRRKVATITTDAKGAYTYESRPTSSRAVELSYSRLRGATTYQSTHAVRVQVQAGMQVRLRSGRVASRGLVVMKGRVQASDLPRNGVMVQLQARDRGKWISAGLTRTKQDGSFTWKYRLRATSGQIPFRAVLRRTGDLPASVNSSRVVKVRIG